MPQSQKPYHVSSQNPLLVCELVANTQESSLGTACSLRPSGANGRKAGSSLTAEPNVFAMLGCCAAILSMSSNIWRRLYWLLWPLAAST